MGVCPSRSNASPAVTASTGSGIGDADAAHEASRDTGTACRDEVSADTGSACRDEDECSAASALLDPLPFFARDGERLKVLNLMVGDDSLLEEEPIFSLECPPRAAAWSPDGLALAVVDPVKGVTIIGFPEDGSEPSTLLDSGHLHNAQQLQWSPKSTYLVAQSPFKGEGESNVQIWKRSSDGSYAIDFSLQNPKFERSTFIFEWTRDEELCCRHMTDGSIELLPGSDIKGISLTSVSLPRAAQAFQFTQSSQLGTRLSVFVKDCRDSLQRVIAPAEVFLFELTDNDVSARASVSVQFGQQADLKWSNTGSAVLAHCQTDIDDSGQSYYGGSKLLLISYDAKYSLDLTEAQDSVVQAVDWSPTRDEFVLIQGFQPAKVTCWSWDSKSRQCSVTAVLKEKAHRNTIKWNPYGSMLCVAGFGNLAGEVDFFARHAEKGLQQVSSCEAACTVSAEWSADGRHMMTACLAPRMRVDNGLGVWFALTGTRVANLPFAELLEVQWRPEPPNSDRFVDVSTAEIEHALSGASTRLKPAGGEKKKQAYRPPTARGGGDNKVAQMMRGEVPNATPPKPKAPEPKAPIEPKVELKPEAKRPELNQHGSKAPCPTSGWEYMDNKGKVQGPFTLEQMQNWFSRGAFKPTLKMRCDPGDKFIPLSELFPHPMVPFLRAPKRPNAALKEALRDR